MRPNSLSLDDAVNTLLEVAQPILKHESVLLSEALGRIAAETVLTRHDQPPFDRSPLDGFALHHADTVDASVENPACLTVVADIFAGDGGRDRLERGQAARILTGAPIPPGATCVVRQEDVTVENGRVSLPYRLGEYQNYCFRGEYLVKESVLVRKGERIDRGSVALLAGDGVAEVPVAAQPRIAVLSTGNELTAPGVALGPGAIYDSNRPLLAARSTELGALVSADRTAGDDPVAIADAIRDLLPMCDLLVTTGGVSVGERDYLPEAVALAGATQLFHGVQVRPGSPALAASLDGKLILCLSGNPFAAFVTYELLAAPTLRRLAGLAEPLAQRIPCRLGEDFSKSGKQRRFAPGKISGGEIFFPNGKAGSRSLATLAGANCLVEIAPGEHGAPRGSMVEAILL